MGSVSKARQLRRFIKQTRDRLHTLLIWRHDSGNAEDPTWLQQFFHFWVLAVAGVEAALELLHDRAIEVDG